MKSVLLMILLLSAAAVAQTTSSLTVEEVFSVDTPEEMEAALAEGYPMPWLEELLNDQSIPEEDRYWLDCRVRAVIARELHAFFDREGNRIDVVAEGGIRNGESYWRETFIVEPDFVDYWAIARQENPYYPEAFPNLPGPYHFLRTPGYLCNRYGEQTGEIATTDIKIHLSRDGSVGVYASGALPHYDPSRIFFLNSNNEVKEITIGPRVSGMNSISMSDDGSMALVVCLGLDENTPLNDSATDLDVDLRGSPKLLVFTGTGELLYKKDMPDFPTTYPAQFSPDSRYIAYPMGSPNGTVIMDASTGETLHTLDVYAGYNSSFTRNSQYLCLPSVDFGSIHNCETGETVLSFDLGPHPDYGWTHCHHERISAGNDLRVISGDRVLRPPQLENLYFNELFIDSQLYSSVEMENFQYQEVSPNGYFIDMQNYTPFIGGLWDGPAIPYTVLFVRGERQ